MDLAKAVVVALGANEVEELVGGHQSRVFRVIGCGGHLSVAKVLDSSMVDRGELEARLDAIAELADLDPRVCRPLLIHGRRVTELTSGGGQLQFAACYEFARGTEPNPVSAADAERMGTALSELHLSMSQVQATGLPVIRALRAVSSDDWPAAGPHQFLHGDFRASNLHWEVTS